MITNLRMEIFEALVMPPSADKRLLHEAVRVKDNSAQIAAMEAALPYLYMLRQLRAAYRGACPALLRLPARQFLQTYFNPSIARRRDTAISFMLIVYR